MSTVAERAVRAAVALAAEHGVRVTDPLVLHDGSNVLVHLRPAPVVARVATPTGTRAVRSGPAWLAREVALASHLAERGAPVVAPSAVLPPGPHERDGFAISLWTHVPPTEDGLDPEEAGRRLRACHDALGDFSFEGELPRMGALREARELVERMEREAALGPDEAARLRAAGAAASSLVNRLILPLQPVHGDAHLRNAIASPAGPLWLDWEDAFLGPRAWDLACLHASARPFGRRDPDAVGAALRGYGEADDPDVVAAFVAARRFQVVVWGFQLARARPADRAWAQERLPALGDNPG